MNIIYYYNDNCSCCQDYYKFVDRLSTELKISCEKQNVGQIRPLYKLDGVPTVILEDNGKEVARSIGNLPYGLLKKEFEKYVK